MSNIEYKVGYWDKEETKKRYECWYLNGQYHKKDGPAYIDHYENGQVAYEYWYLNGKLHRENGPAWISYCENEQVRYENWYLNGKELSEERVEQLKLEKEADKCIEEMLNE